MSRLPADFGSVRILQKEVGGRIVSSIIEERGKLHNKSSLWCKSLFEIGSKELTLFATAISY